MTVAAVGTTRGVAGARTLYKCLILDAFLTPSVGSLLFHRGSKSELLLFFILIFIACSVASVEVKYFFG